MEIWAIASQLSTGLSQDNEQKKKLGENETQDF